MPAFNSISPDKLFRLVETAAVGADSPEKSEISPELMANAKVVADVLEQGVALAA